MTHLGLSQKTKSFGVFLGNGADGGTRTRTARATTPEIPAQKTPSEPL